MKRPTSKSMKRAALKLQNLLSGGKNIVAAVWERSDDVRFALAQNSQFFFQQFCYHLKPYFERIAKGDSVTYIETGVLGFISSLIIATFALVQTLPSFSLSYL